MGRCNRCKECDRPCRVFTYNGDRNSEPSANNDCIFWPETGVECVRMSMEELILAEGEMDD